MSARIARTVRNPRWWILLPAMVLLAVPVLATGLVAWSGYGLTWLGEQMERELDRLLRPMLRWLTDWGRAKQDPTP